MNKSETILEFQNVTVEKHTYYDTGLTDVSFTLHAGELAAVLLEKPHWVIPLADAAEGLVAFKEGRVLFTGQDWHTVEPDQQIELRHHIGRVFEGPTWISNLDIDENVTLAQRYHTQRPEKEIYDEAHELAKFFGLDELPHLRPVAVSRDILRRAEWVRAFLGNPKLVLLERPTHELPDEWNELLYKKIQEALQKGAAVLWTLSNAETWDRIDTKPSLKFKRHLTKMIPAEKNNG